MVEFEPQRLELLSREGITRLSWLCGATSSPHVMVCCCYFILFRLKHPGCILTTQVNVLRIFRSIIELEPKYLDLVYHSEGFQRLLQLLPEVLDQSFRSEV
jgi:hypothetical protein